MLTLSEDTKLTRVSNAVAAGTTVVNSASVDMSGFDGVAFVVALGAITATAVTSVKVQQSSDDGVADAYADLAGTGIVVADTDDDKLFVVDVAHPTERFLRAVVSRGTANAAVDGILAVQYRPKKTPTTHDAATVGGVETHPAPDEGVA